MATKARSSRSTDSASDFRDLFGVDSEWESDGRGKLILVITVIIIENLHSWTIYTQKSVDQNSITCNDNSQNHNKD